MISVSITAKIANTYIALPFMADTPLSALAHLILNPVRQLLLLSPVFGQCDLGIERLTYPRFCDKQWSHLIKIGSLPSEMYT